MNTCTYSVKVVRSILSLIVLLLLVNIKVTGQNLTQSTNDPEGGRTVATQSLTCFYVLLTPDSNTGSSAIVLFDVDGQGRLIQRTTYGTGGLSRASSTSQSIVVDSINK